METKRPKNIAAASTYFSFFGLYIVLAIYGYVKMTDVGKNGNGSTSATIAVILGIIVFVVGLLGLLYMLFFFKPRVKRIVKDAHKAFEKTLQSAKSVSPKASDMEEKNDS